MISAKTIYGQESFFDSDEEKRKNACKGYYSLKMLKKTASSELWILKDNIKNSITINLPETPPIIRLYTCVDIDNDGHKEAIVEYFTGGAHCCFEYHFYKKKKKGIKLLGRLLLGNASQPVFKDINNDGKLEILTFDDSFAYFQELCYACSPTLPMILCYDDKTLYDCTNQFPDILDSEIEKTLKQKEEHPAYRKGLALQYLLLNIIKGENKDVWHGVRKYYPEFYLWLRENEKEINQLLIFRGNKKIRFSKKT